MDSDSVENFVSSDGEFPKTTGGFATDATGDGGEDPFDTPLKEGATPEEVKTHRKAL